MKRFWHDTKVRGWVGGSCTTFLLHCVLLWCHTPPTPYSHISSSHLTRHEGGRVMHSLCACVNYFNTFSTRFICTPYSIIYHPLDDSSSVSLTKARSLLLRVITFSHLQSIQHHVLLPASITRCVGQDEGALAVVAEATSGEKIRCFGADFACQLVR